MDSIWDQPASKVARGLLGRLLILQEKEVIILRAVGYPRKQNERGVYKAVLEMQPGEVYCPRYRNTILLLIVTADGGCALIRTVEINGTIYDGPGHITAALGLTTPRQVGNMVSIDDATYTIAFQDAPTPVPHAPVPTSPRHSNGVGTATMQRLMPSIVKAYLKNRPEGGFQAFVNDWLFRVAK